ncbi:MAG: ABC transporter ATP-binding protein [Aureliella sp.]
MKNFVRALRMASRYWLSVLMAAACSFAVAALWGANIGAFFPILEVTIRGKSTQQWVDEELAKHQLALHTFDAQIAEKSQLVEQAEQRVVAIDESQVKQALETRDSLYSQRAISQAQYDSYRKMQPWVQKYVPSSPFNTIALIVVALVVSTLVKHVFLIANEVLVARVAIDISRTLRNQVFARALTMDRGAFGRHGNASFVTLIVHTTDMLSAGLINTMGAALREPLKVVACLIGAAMICWRLLVVSVLIAPIVMILLVFLTRRLKWVSTRVLSQSTGFHEVLLESLNNIQTVQAFRREGAEQDRFESATLLLRRVCIKFQILTSLSKPIIEFLGIGMLGTTIIGGAYLVLNQETHLLGIPICNQPMSVSALLVFFGMLVGISDPLRKLSSVYTSIYAGAVAADAIFPLLDGTSNIADPDKPQSVSRPHQSLTINQASFGYSAEQTIIHDVTMQIPFGSTVAIVGSNGSGKSTLINLLFRFYDPQSGNIQFDNVDYKDMLVEDVRSRFALVNQQTELFNETVAYNIRYGNPDASDAEIERVARAAHAHEFISTVLEQGYQTKVGQNGNRLSGGQRQRIALARALLCDPEVLILDEATSQIDMQSEQLIRESLAEHRGERTMIIITHREKLLELADVVYEVVDGRLIERPHLAARAA